MKQVDQFTTSIRKCARCGQDHDSVTVKKFLNGPIRDIYDNNYISAEWHYYTTCPTTGEPILISAPVGTGNYYEEK